MVLFFGFLKVVGQESVVGEYYNYFGSNLKINADSTFKYTWRFDLASSWTKGKWKVKNDTIFLEVIPVYDTLKYYSGGGKVLRDSLLLSLDEKSESITSEQFAMYSLTGGGQDKESIPKKLYYRNGRLFGIKENGDLRRKRVKGFMTNRKYVPWYIKKED